MNSGEIRECRLAISKPYYKALLLKAREQLNVGKAESVVKTRSGGWVPRVGNPMEFTTLWSQYSRGPGNRATKFESCLRFTHRNDSVSLNHFVTLITGSGAYSSPIRLELSFGLETIFKVDLSWEGFYPDTGLYLLDNALGGLIKGFYFCTRVAEGVNWGKLFITGSREAAEFDYPSSVTTYSTSDSAIRWSLWGSPTLELTQCIIGQKETSKRFVAGGYTEFKVNRKHLSYIYDPATGNFLVYVHGPMGESNPQVYNAKSVVREMAGLPAKTTESQAEDMTSTRFLDVYRSVLKLIPVAPALADVILEEMTLYRLGYLASGGDYYGSRRGSRRVEEARRGLKR